MNRTPVVISLTLLFWAGFVSSISFMEAWLKFQSGVTDLHGLFVNPPEKIFNNIKKTMKTKYLPVDPDYLENFEHAISAKHTVTVQYFEKENTLKKAEGRVTQISLNKKDEEYLEFENGQKIRLDRIIVFNGKPGPAFDEYDSFALACLDCMGGMD